MFKLRTLFLLLGPVLLTLLISNVLLSQNPRNLNPKQKKKNAKLPPENISGARLANAQYNFTPSNLRGPVLGNPTSLQFGPDRRLYVSELYGIIRIYTVVRNDTNDYAITATETIDLINQIPNHNDDGTLAPSIVVRQLTGILIKGTAAQPLIYVTSSDIRNSAGGQNGDYNLDTNSGILSLIFKSGNSWEKIDLVRGLPRSEESHAPFGMQLDDQTNTMYMAVGGFTNAGAPSVNFVYITEYALSAAILSINMNVINALPVKDTGNRRYKYDLPTVDDPTRANNPDGSDVFDPFGGNDGLNQAKIVQGGPVQVYSPGYRNPYDLLITKTPGKARRMYTVDNGGNQGWGGYPANEGSNGTVTNNYVAGEPGSTGPGTNDPMVNNLDNLHFIGHIDSILPGSHYGGHPAPIRANPAGAGLYTHDGTTGIWRTTKTGANPLPADWPPVPLNMANPVEGNFQNPGETDRALLTFAISTNGIAEYTASNFNNSLKGHLLAAAWDGNIFHITPTENGADVTNPRDPANKLNTDLPFASGFSLQPLDVIAQGDNDIFPGSVWSVNFNSNNVTVFEPQDFVTCTGVYDSLDDDRDGYTNADEIDNGTQPCSAASIPADSDHDMISDLNDFDDDNDGIFDNVDAFALDANNGLTTGLPVVYDLFNSDPGTGLFGLGFTGLMTNKKIDNDYSEVFSEDSVIAGGAVGAFTLTSVSPGDALNTLNNQENGFQFGVKIPASTSFTVSSRMLGPFFSSNPPANFQSQGIYIGTGDQSNYFKLTLNANGGSGGIEVVHEVADVATTYQYPLSGGIPNSTLDLFMLVDPVNGTIQPKYASNGGTQITAGLPIQVSGALLNAIQGTTALAVGLISTSRGASRFIATWDFIHVTASNQSFVANAGPDKTIIVPASSTTLNGSGTGTITAYAWNQVSGPNTATFNSKTVAAPVVSGLIAGTYVFTLVVTNNQGVSSAPDQVSVNVNGPVYRINAGGPPVTNSIGAFQADAFYAPTPGNTYSTGSPIDGTTNDEIYQSERYGTNAMFDYNFPLSNGQYTVILHFAEIYYADPGKRIFDVTLEGTKLLSNYDIVAKVGSFYATTETLPVTVNDGTLNIHFNVSTAGVDGPKISAIEIIRSSSSNQPPMANAGPDQTITLPANSITLNGSGTDADGTVAGYTWSQSSGPNTATFTSKTVAAPTVSGMIAGNYVFSLVVTDNQGAVSTPDQVSIAVTSATNQPPVANAGSDKIITLPVNSTQLDGSGTDADGTVSSFTWSQSSGPNTAAFNSNTVPLPTVSGLVAGTYVFSLVITDNQGAASAPDQVTVTVNPGGGQAPVANAGPDKTIILPSSSTTLNGSGTGTITAYAWNQVSGPNTATFNSKTVAAPVVSGLIAGTYVFTLVVTNNQGVSSAPDQVSVNVNGPVYRINAGGPPVTNSIGAFQADAFYAPTPGNTYSTGSPIDGTTNDEIYQSERYGTNAMFDYNFPLSNGQYTVILHFAEIYYADPGKRIFDVTLEGTKLLSNYDIVAKVGSFYATTETLPVTVNDGTLNIHFNVSTAGVDGPKISAIEIIRSSSSNQPPMANAGPDQTITLPANSITLNGSGTDADGTVAGYTWSQSSGPNTATFTSKTVAAPTVSGMIAGTYVFSLVVTDNQGAVSAPDQVSVTVNPAANQPPVANAGPDKIVTLPVNSTQLNGSGTDADGTVSSYTWSQSSGPNTATFTSKTVAAPTVSGMIAGTYVFSLVVTDNQGAVSAPDQVSVTVNPAANQPPVANAGPDKIVTLPVNSTQLNGSGTDADGSVSSYTWSQSSGPNTATFTSKTVAAPTVSGLVAGTYVFSLVVTDNQGAASVPDQVSVTVNPAANQPPVANAGPDKIVTLPVNSTQLNGSGTDADGSVSSYTWSQSSGPNTATFTSKTVAAPTVSGLVAGTYVFSLVVTDNQGAVSVPDQVTINVDGVIYRVNSGGAQVTNSIGTFAADAFYSPTPGNTYSTNTAIAATTDDAMYQNARNSSTRAFGYTFPVSNGRYRVILHFAEINTTGLGKRLFDVTLEGTLGLNNYDIFKKVGTFTATTESLTVDVLDGNLNINFSSLAADGGVNRPLVSAIEIIRSSGASGQINVAKAENILSWPGQEKSRLSVQKLEAKVLPNPSNHYFTLHIRSGDNKPVAVRVLNAAGNVIELRMNQPVNKTLQLGANYRPGKYYVQVIQGNEKLTLQLIKQSELQ
ncbi:MAG: malectin domain-containing carbohydrate-binding protein [Chitinophagaceae bacterium]